MTISAQVAAPNRINGENRYLRAGLCPDALSRVGLTILCGPQGYLYAVELIETNQQRPDTAVLAYLEANRPNILFVLGIKCLWLALLAIRARATTFFHVRLHPQEGECRRPLEGK